MSDIKKKLAGLSKGKSSMATKKTLWRRENRNWLKKSQAIAFEVLAALDQKKLTQKKLAELLAVSPQYVNNIVKGSENLTLETIARLENALGIALISILQSEQAFSEDVQKVKNKPKNKITHKKAA
jgi:plasmid maintenance system antidote protein VapI